MAAAVELIEMRPAGDGLYVCYHMTFRLNGNSTFNTFATTPRQGWRIARRMARRARRSR